MRDEEELADRGNSMCKGLETRVHMALSNESKVRLFRAVNGKNGKRGGWGSKIPKDFLVHRAWSLCLVLGVGCQQRVTTGFGDYVRPKQVREEGIGKEGQQKIWATWKPFLSI